MYFWDCRALICCSHRGPGPISGLINTQTPARRDLKQNKCLNAQISKLKWYLNVVIGTVRCYIPHPIRIPTIPSHPPTHPFIAHGATSVLKCKLLYTPRDFHPTQSSPIHPLIAYAATSVSDWKTDWKKRLRLENKQLNDRKYLYANILGSCINQRIFLLKNLFVLFLDIRHTWLIVPPWE